LLFVGPRREQNSLGKFPVMQLQEVPPVTSSKTSAAEISEARRALLQKYLQGVSTPTTASGAITRRAANEPARVSFAQERLWFLDQLMPGSPVFNVPLAVRLPHAIDARVLEQCLNEIVRRHEILRTTFATVAGQPAPVIQPELKLALQVFDLANLAEDAREAAARQIAVADAERAFDLVQSPLIRAILIHLGTEDHVFQVTLHHICSDGWSLVVFFQELSTLYEALARGSSSPLAEPAIQYADYASWQRQWLQGEVLQTQLQYWKQQLGGELPVLDLPTDRPRPAVQTYPGARTAITLSSELSEALMSLSQREGATLFMTLLAAFKVLLHRYSGQDDIIVGAPIANRPQSESEQLIGYFLNNLALRTDLSGNPNFRQALTRVRQTALGAYAHQDVPFEKLIEELKPERDLSRTTIFQVYFNLFNFADEVKLPGAPGAGVSFFEAWSQSEENLSKFDLTLYAGVVKSNLNGNRQIKLAFVYNTDLFDEASITRMLDHFRSLLAGVVNNPQLPVADQALLSSAMIGEIAEPVRPTNDFEYFERAEIEQSIPDRFAFQVAKYSQKIAIKSSKHEWSYERLNRNANRVARLILRKRGEGQERVALLFEHDAPMIAALLGTLKAGKSYVPLDPAYPVERLAHILKDSQAGALVTNNRNLATARELCCNGLRLINIDGVEWNDPDRETESDVNLSPDPRDLAYLLYTSGSTGQPKGVMQNHRNVLHFIRAYTNNLHLSASDHLTLLSSYCFDASVMDIFGALLNGATLHTIDIKAEGLGGLADRLSREGISIYHSTPSVYRYFLGSLAADRRLSTVRLVVLGGEAVNRADVELYQKHFPKECLFVNGLGPTEATVSLQYFVDHKTRVTGQSVPVGYPVADTEVLLLNEAGQPAALRGEIALNCEHVALGYWRNTKATLAAFSSDPLSLNRRIYRTGDMGRRLPDGAIVFEGRKDSQVKIRGFRVELGEIEIALAKHAAVRDNVVVTRRNEAGEQLIAYVVIAPAQTTGENELRDFLRQKLPEYMIPVSFVELESLPLTASGKLNRRALPEPKDLQTRMQSVSPQPKTSVEKALARLWSDLLGAKQPGVNDNFFELGGHSLLAVRLFAQIEKQFAKRLPLATLFKAPTIAQLAALIDRQCAPQWSSLVPIQPGGDRPPFFCVHALGGNVLEYHDLARHLGPDQPFYGLQSQGLNGRQALHTRIEDMAAHYIKEMRELQPTGPYFIGGRSLGGTIAFEMASQLRSQGEEVGLLALLDTYPSGYLKLLLNTSAARRRWDCLRNRWNSHVANLKEITPREQVQYLLSKLRYSPAKSKAWLWRQIYQTCQRLGRPLPRVLRDVKEFNSMAARKYEPQVYDGEITLFWASGDRRASSDLVSGWRVLAGRGIHVHEISGNHLNIIKEPYVAELALKLRGCLVQSQAPALVRESQSSARPKDRTATAPQRSPSGPWLPADSLLVQ
jgi:amino acid adenylation domain-containing protein